MKSFSLALICATSAAIKVAEEHIPTYDDEYVHTHVEYGEADKFRDIPVVYEEIEYTIDHRNEPELRTRQIAIPYIHTETETKYYADEEQRFTTNYEVKYHSDYITKYEFVPRIIYDSYIVTHYRDVPYTVWEPRYDVLYREEEEHRYRHEIDYAVRTDTKTVYDDVEEIRYTNEYEVLYREEQEIRYDTVFDT